MVFVDPTGLTPQQYLKKFQDAFALENKYKVLGVFDTVLSGIGGAIPDDGQFAALKAARTTAATIIKSKASSADPDDKKISARAQLNFARTAAYAIDAAKTTNTATKAAAAIYTVTNELQASVNKYIDAANDSPDLAKDTAFKNSALQTYNKLMSLITATKPRLIGEQVYYSANIAKASAALASIKATLASFTPSTPAAAPASAPTGDGSTVDVTV